MLKNNHLLSNNLNVPLLPPEAISSQYIDYMYILITLTCFKDYIIVEFVPATILFPF